MSETPNVVIENPDLRRNLGKALYIVSGLVGIAVFIFTGVPGLPFDLDFWAAKVIGVIAMLGSVFGLTVTTPNVPRSA